MKVLVSGANGFIGSNLCEKLVAAGHQVRGLILKGTPEWYLDNIPVEKIYADVTRPETLKDAVAGIDNVFHLAAIAKDWGKWESFITVNAGGTENLARAAAQAGVKRFLLTSSIAVHHYRDIENGDENFPRDCGKFAYGQSKIMAEDRLRMVCASTGMGYVIVRPAVFPFGPKDTTSFFKMAEAIEKGGFGFVNSGRSRITVGFVENLCDGMVLAGFHPQAKDDLFLIDDGIALSWKEIVEAICKELGAKMPRLNLPRPAAWSVAGLMELAWKTLPLPGEPLLTRYRINVASTDLIFSSQKIRDKLGFVPKVPLEQAMKKTVEWYKKAKADGLKI
jgi:nucleoside-diphosphate-sugar epimerase